MEWSAGFRKIFHNKITLPAKNAGDLVVFCRQTNNSLKIGTKAEVPDGFALVTVHYNKVCDVLNIGDYELDGTTVPIIMKYCQKQATKRGEFLPNSVFADVYFVALSRNSSFDFLTPNYICTKGQTGKVKIRLKGTFRLHMINVSRFMQDFCDSYAVVKNKRVLKDLSYYVGRCAERAFDKNDFVLSDFLGGKDKIANVILRNVGELEKDLGVKIYDVVVTEVLVPRRYRISKGYLIDSKNANTNNEFLIKMVEDRLNNLQDDLSVVFSGHKTESPKENNAKNNNFTYTAPPNETKYEDIGKNTSSSENIFTQDTPNDFEQTFKEQVAPKIIVEETHQQTENISHSDPKTAEKPKSKTALIDCLCCGAKNFPQADCCCVCKSKLY